MESWPGYTAVSYGQRVETAAGFQPYGCQAGGGYQPTYDQPTLLAAPPLLHQKTHYSRPEEADWPQHHPFGVLPHEAVASSFPFPSQQNPSPLTPHHVPPRRPLSPHDPTSPSFFQPPAFPPPQDSLQKMDYTAPRLYQNLQHIPEEPLRDYRYPDFNTPYDKNDVKKTSDLSSRSRLYQEQTIDLVSKDYRFQTEQERLYTGVESNKKSIESEQGEYSQSSPISFAMMDQRMRSPRFQGTTFRYTSGVPAPEEEFQRSKSSESFSSSSSGELQRRSSPVASDPYVVRSSREPRLPRYQPPVYPSLLLREKDTVEVEETWDTDRRKYPVQGGVRLQQQGDANHGSCRGDPMSLVRNLQDSTCVQEKKNYGDVEELLREPPPAHHNANQNGYFDFDRWNLSTGPGKILTFNRNHRLTEDCPRSLVTATVPATYFPALQIRPPPTSQQQQPDDAPKTSPLTIEDELSYLASDEEPLKITFVPKIERKSCIKEYNKFLKGCKEETHGKTVRKVSTWSKPCSFTKINRPTTQEPSTSSLASTTTLHTSTTPTTLHSTTLCPPSTDHRDDPRYFPLPESSDMRSFDSSSDSSNDSFSLFFSPRSRTIHSDPVKPSSPSRDSTWKPKSSSPSYHTSKKIKLHKEERSTQTVLNNECNHIDHSTTSRDGENRLSACPCTRTPPSCHNSLAPTTALECTTPPSDSTQKQQHTTPTNSVPGKKSTGLSKGGKVQRNISQINKQTVGKSKNKTPAASSFEVGDFLVHKCDRDLIYPPIWRLKERSILQKFQHFVKDGMSLYIGLPSVVAWGSEMSELYHSVPVTVTLVNKCSASSSKIVQVVNLPAQQTRQHKQFIESYLKETAHLQDSFEVFIQTLFSQALDSNFLQEIYDEKDEYFLARVRDVEAVLTGLRSRLKLALNWPNTSSLDSVTRWPSYRLAVAPRPHRTCLCTKSPSSSLIVLHGNPYHPHTLHRISSNTVPLNKELVVCEVCRKYLEVLHSVCHQKLCLYMTCEERVNKARDPAKDTTSLLNHLLADQPFLNQLFREVRLSWARIEKCLKDGGVSFSHQVS